jgi:hypothetical protein
MSEEAREFHPGVWMAPEDGWFTKELRAAAIPADGESDEGYWLKRESVDQVELLPICFGMC